MRALDALVLVQQYHMGAKVLHGRAHKVAALALQVQPSLDLVRVLVLDVPLQEPPLRDEIAVRTLACKWSKFDLFKFSAKKLDKPPPDPLSLSAMPSCLSLMCTLSLASVETLRGQCGQRMLRAPCLEQRVVAVPFKFKLSSLRRNLSKLKFQSEMNSVPKKGNLYTTLPGSHVLVQRVPLGPRELALRTLEHPLSVVELLAVRNQVHVGLGRKATEVTRSRYI